MEDTQDNSLPLEHTKDNHRGDTQGSSLLQGLTRDSHREDTQARVTQVQLPPAWTPMWHRGSVQWTRTTQDRSTPRSCVRHCKMATGPNFLMRLAGS